MAKQSKGGKAKATAATIETSASATIETRLHDMAAVAMRAAVAASEAQGAAKQSKEGAAVTALRMYQTGATEATLRQAFESVESEARSGKLEGVTLQTAARKGKDGGVAYLIPGSFMNAKSIVTKAANYDLPRNVESFGALRDLVKAETDRLKAAESPLAAAKMELTRQAKNVVDLVAEVLKDDGDSLTLAQVGAMAHILQLAQARIENARPTTGTVAAAVTAAQAEAIAEAA